MELFYSLLPQIEQVTPGYLKDYLELTGVRLNFWERKVLYGMAVNFINARAAARDPEALDPTLTEREKGIIRRDRLREKMFGGMKRE